MQAHSKYDGLDAVLMHVPLLHVIPVHGAFLIKKNICSKLVRKLLLLNKIFSNYVFDNLDPYNH